MKVIVDEDIRIPANSESIVMAHLKEKYKDLTIGFIEPREPTEDGVIVAKCLVKIEQV